MTPPTHTPTPTSFGGLLRWSQNVLSCHHFINKTTTDYYITLEDERHGIQEAKVQIPRNKCSIDIFSEICLISGKSYKAISQKDDCQAPWKRTGRPPKEVGKCRTGARGGAAGGT